jgi:DNA-binding helix-hairpin-helix protein with protein kinase domain
MQSVRIGSKSIELGKRIGRGGEGDVFVQSNNANCAIKIYKQNLRSQREPKVRSMVAKSIAKASNLVAFPQEVALDKNGKFAGFSMQLVSGYRPLHELYSPKSRQRHFPEVDYRFLIRAAGNLARAIAQVHQSGCVIGDINHSGILVSKEATVALIDADSFQFTADGVVHPCVVGVPDFTPPELHGINLSTVNRTVEHDYFGLAVAIFHLLLMGRHPYAGVYPGKDLSLSEAIEQNRFAFSRVRRSQTNTTPPPGSITMDDLHPPVASAFEYAFGLTPSSRPNGAMWGSLLSEFEGALSRCSQQKRHFYASAAGKCIWCEVLSNSGFDMFPDLSGSSPRINIPHADISKILSALGSMSIPSIRALIPSVSGKANKPGQAAKGAMASKRGQQLVGIASLVGAGAGFFNIPDLWFVWIGLGIFALNRLAADIDTAPIRQAYQSADSQAQVALSNFLKNTGVFEMYLLKDDLDKLAAEYSGLGAGLQSELSKLSSTRTERQKSAYLDQFRIRDASIHGIGPAKTSTLASFGIETAADVTRGSVMRVPGFGEVTTRDLLNWRNKYESRFKYNPAPTAADAQAENAVRSKYDKRKSDLELKIKKSYSDLTNGMSKLSAAKTRAQSDPNLKQAFERRAQAEADMKALGLPVHPFDPDILKSQPQTQTRQTSNPTARSSTSRTSRSSGTSSKPSCPSCGSVMVKRLARRGRNAGGYFWGCSNYPRCIGTRNI